MILAYHCIEETEVYLNKLASLQCADCKFAEGFEDGALEGFFFSYYKILFYGAL